LASETKTNVIKKKSQDKISYFTKLQKVIREEHQDVYLSDTLINKIKYNIDLEIEEIKITRITEDIMNLIIDEIVNKNAKFDFCLPFD
jgi:hypothetical protein